MIQLLGIIRDLCHKHDETKQGTMALVESDLILFTSFQSATDSPLEYLQVFRAQIETINTHDGRSGYHPKLEEQHLKALLEREKVKDIPVLIAQDADKAEKLIKKATAAACKEYLACLFLCMSNNT